MFPARLRLCGDPHAPDEIARPQGQNGLEPDDAAPPPSSTSAQPASAGRRRCPGRRVRSRVWPTIPWLSIGREAPGLSTPMPFDLQDHGAFPHRPPPDLEGETPTPSRPPEAPRAAARRRGRAAGPHSRAFSCRATSTAVSGGDAACCKNPGPEMHPWHRWGQVLQSCTPTAASCCSPRDSARPSVAQCTPRRYVTAITGSPGSWAARAQRASRSSPFALRAPSETRGQREGHPALHPRTQARHRWRPARHEDRASGSAPAHWRRRLRKPRFQILPVQALGRRASGRGTEGTRRIRRHDRRSDRQGEILYSTAQARTARKRSRSVSLETMAWRPLLPPTLPRARRRNIGSHSMYRRRYARPMTTGSLS